MAVESEGCEVNFKAHVTMKSNALSNAEVRCNQLNPELTRCTIDGLRLLEANHRLFLVISNPVDSPDVVPLGFSARTDIESIESVGGGVLL